jgi:hypothetical protein
MVQSHTIPSSTQPYVMGLYAIREIEGHFIIVVIRPNKDERQLFRASTLNEAVEWVRWLRQAQSRVRS